MRKKSKEKLPKPGLPDLVDLGAAAKFYEAFCTCKYCGDKKKGNPKTQVCIECQGLLDKKAGGESTVTKLACPRCGGVRFHVELVSIPNFYFDGSAYENPRERCCLCGWTSVPEDYGEIRLMTDLALKWQHGDRATPFPKQWSFVKAQQEPGPELIIDEIEVQDENHRNP